MESFTSHRLITLRMQAQAAAFLRDLRDAREKPEGPVDVWAILSEVAERAASA